MSLSSRISANSGVRQSACINRIRGCGIARTSEIIPFEGVPVKTLDLESLSDDDVPSKINGSSLDALRNVMISHCSFSFAAFSTFIHTFQRSICEHGTGTSRIAERRGPRRSDHPKMSLEPATRMSLTCISGTAMTLRTLLSVANTFFDQLLSRELSKRFPGVKVPVFPLFLLDSDRVLLWRRTQTRA